MSDNREAEYEAYECLARALRAAGHRVGALQVHVGQLRGPAPFVQRRHDFRVTACVGPALTEISLKIEIKVSNPKRERAAGGQAMYHFAAHGESGESFLDVHRWQASRQEEAHALIFVVRRPSTASWATGWAAFPVPLARTLPDVPRPGSHAHQALSVSALQRALLKLPPGRGPARKPGLEDLFGQSYGPHLGVGRQPSDFAALVLGWMEHVLAAFDAQRAADVAGRKARGKSSRLADAAKRLKR